MYRENKNNTAPTATCKNSISNVFSVSLSPPYLDHVYVYLYARDCAYIVEYYAYVFEFFCHLLLKINQEHGLL